jgi:hypothetical protein
MAEILKKTGWSPLSLNFQMFWDERVIQSERLIYVEQHNATMISIHTMIKYLIKSEIILININQCARNNFSLTPTRF